MGGSPGLSFPLAQPLVNMKPGPMQAHTTGAYFAHSLSALSSWGGEHTTYIAPSLTAQRDSRPLHSKSKHASQRDFVTSMIVLKLPNGGQCCGAAG